MVCCLVVLHGLFDSLLLCYVDFHVFAFFLPDDSGVATRLSAPGTGRAPVIFESSGPNSAGAQGGAGAFVICEICDGYIKDLEQLRTHMQWIHKVNR